MAYTIAKVQEAKGLTDDEWADLSMDAKYGALALHRAEATTQAWEALGRKGRAMAIMNYQAHQRKERKQREKDDDSGRDV